MGGQQGLGGVCRGVCRTVLEACGSALWGGNRVLEACRFVLRCVTDAYEMSQGDQKEKGRYQPPHGGWYFPMKGLCYE